MTDKIDDAVTPLRLNAGLGGRLTKCLVRVEQHKSKPDFEAVLRLEEMGLISISGSSDNLSIEITAEGRKKLPPNDKVRGGGK